jgi:hypothetical protein
LVRASGVVYDTSMSPSHAAFFLLLISKAGSSNPEAEVVQTAESYLRGLTGTGDEAARALLLGGVTMDAQLTSLENWRIVSKEPLRTEEGDLRLAVPLMHDLDRAGRVAARTMMNGKAKTNDLTVVELSQADAAKLLAPTKEKAQKFSASFPLLAYVARVGKEIYWHPKNPVRALLAKAGERGKYSLQLQRFKIESREGPRQVARNWPLRVLRFRTDALDTGWRILPASDWSPD